MAKRNLEIVRSAAWPFKLLVSSQILALVVFIKLALGMHSALQIISIFGLCVAWGAALAALLATIGAVVEIARRRQSTVMRTRIAPLLMTLCGAGFVGGMAPLLIGGQRRMGLAVAATGVLLLGYGLWRRRTGYPNPLYAVLHLVLVVLAFSAPRESGFFSLTWANIDQRTRFSRDGSFSCRSGGQLVGSSALAIRKPPYVFRTRTLRGLLGQKVALLLGHSRLPNRRDGIAVIEVSGRVDGASSSCYFPGYHSETIGGELSIELSYREHPKDTRGNTSQLSCSGLEAMRFTIEASLTGVGSCNDLMRHAAATLVTRIRKRARQLTGHHN